MSVRTFIPFGGEFPSIGPFLTGRFAFPFLGGDGVGGAGMDTTERFIVIPRACVVSSIYMNARNDGAISGTNTVTGTYIVRQGTGSGSMADTSLALAVVKDHDDDPWTGTATGSVTYAAGDRLAIKVVTDVAFDTANAPSGINIALLVTF